MSFFRISLTLLLILQATLVFSADVIRGVVRNQTTGQPAVGDEVILLGLGEGMQEESRTRTDAQGAFTLNVASPQTQHLIQVSHRGVNYDQPVSGASPVDVGVYDSVTTIPGLGGPIGIVQLESDGKVMKVTEMVEISNKSNPPVTQSRTNNFELTVPPKASFESVQVRRGQGLWLKITADPIGSHPGKYGINYPIRPGETLFKFVYHFPYERSAVFHLKLPYPIEKFGVVHPASMTFKPSHPEAFDSPGMAGNLKIEHAVATPLVGDVPAFEISGTGSAPEHGTTQAAEAAGTSGAKEGSQSAGALPSNSSAAAAIPASHGTSTATDQSQKELWVVIAGIVLILAIGALAMWKVHNRQVAAPAGTAPGGNKLVLNALKDELFQLESDRARGSVSAEEYAATKRALTVSIQRAMARK